MVSRISSVFEKCREEGRPAFMPYITGAYPTREDSVEHLLGLQEGGADLIEFGVPFSDPIADGPTVQASSFASLKHGTTLSDCIDFIKEARKRGLTVPVILFTYYNPVLSFGEEKLVEICATEEVGVCGFIVVDMDVEDFKSLSEKCSKFDLALIPLVAPTTTEERLEEIAKFAKGFTYCVAVVGVTGARISLAENVKEYTDKVGRIIKLPRALGFGLSTPEHYEEVKQKKIAEGVVMGSKIVKISATGETVQERKQNLISFVKEVLKSNKP